MFYRIHKSPLKLKNLNPKPQWRTFDQKCGILKKKIVFFENQDVRQKNRASSSFKKNGLYKEKVPKNIKI